MRTPYADKKYDIYNKRQMLMRYVSERLYLEEHVTASFYITNCYWYDMIIIRNIV